MTVKGLFDGRGISLGNWITIIMIVVAAMASWYTQENRVSLVEQQLSQAKEDRMELAARLSMVEAGRVDFLGRLTRIETQLEYQTELLRSIA
ncbi:unnamed protein product, partial [Laminaria digitata]